MYAMIHYRHAEKHKLFRYKFGRFIRIYSRIPRKLPKYFINCLVSWSERGLSSTKKKISLFWQNVMTLFSIDFSVLNIVDNKFL